MIKKEKREEWKRRGRVKGKETKDKKGGIRRHGENKEEKKKRSHLVRTGKPAGCF